MRNLLKSEAGINLVELLGVIAIIAVLASIAMTSVAGVNASARQARAERNAAMLNEAIEKFMAQGGDMEAMLSAPNPLEGIVNTLRSSDASIVRMGGPFIDSGMSPDMASEDWRVILVNRTIDGKMQVYFDVTNDEGAGSGVLGFSPGPIPTGFTPIGVPLRLDDVNSTGSTSAPNLAPGSSTAIPISGQNTVVPPAPTQTPNMSSYY